MMDKEIDNIVSIKDAYFDFVVIAFTLLLVLLVSTMLSIMVTGSRTDGMVTGLYIGLSTGILIFYLLRTIFNLFWTLIQVVLNSALTIGEFLFVAYLTKETMFLEMNYGYIAIIITIPALISLNKLIMDKILIKQNVMITKRRLKM